MQRITAITIINPIDKSPLGVPKLTFGQVRTSPSFPTGWFSIIWKFTV